MKTEKHIFTLVELLAVIAMIAVLAGIAVGVTSLVLNKAATAKTEATIKALEIALNMYNEKFGHYLDVSLTPQALKIPAAIPSTANFDGSLWKFLDQRLINTATVVSGEYRYFKDGWDHPLVYRSPGHFNKTTFDLGSVGPDGKIGNDGTDIPRDVEDSTLTAITNINDTNYAKFGQGDDVVNFVHNSN